MYSEDGSHNFALMTRCLTDTITDSFIINAGTKQITFNRFSDIQRDRQSHFWQLPPQLRGDQVGGVVKGVAGRGGVAIHRFSGNVCTVFLNSTDYQNCSWDFKNIITLFITMEF